MHPDTRLSSCCNSISNIWFSVSSHYIMFQTALKNTQKTNKQTHKTQPKTNETTKTPTKQTQTQPPRQKSTSCWWPQRGLRSCCLCCRSVHPLKKGNDPSIHPFLNLTVWPYSFLHHLAWGFCSFLFVPHLSTLQGLQLNQDPFCSNCWSWPWYAAVVEKLWPNTRSLPFPKRCHSHSGAEHDKCFHHYQHRQHTMQHKYSHGIQSIFLPSTPALPAWIQRWPTTIKHINVNVSRLLLIGNKNVLSKANCREIRSFQYFSRGL